MAKSHTPNTLRFAWWAAEEEGLVGSTVYVQKLAAQPGEVERVELYMKDEIFDQAKLYFRVDELNL